MSNQAGNADFTPTGLKVEGQYENDRNAKNRDLFAAMIKEAYGADQVIIAHHLVYVAVDKRNDGFEYQIVEEIPSADTLIFDVVAAEKIWGERWRVILPQLSVMSTEDRDKYVKHLYYNRT